MLSDGFIWSDPTFSPEPGAPGGQGVFLDFKRFPKLCLSQIPDVKIPPDKYPKQPGLKILDVLMDLKLQPFPKDFYKFSLT